MSSIQSKIIQNTKKKENLANKSWKKKTMNRSQEMTQMSELSKDLKAAVITMLQNVQWTLSKQTER